MADTEVEPPKPSDWWAERRAALGEFVARRAVLVGVVVGGVVGLGIGAIIIAIVRGRRRRAIEVEDERLRGEFEAEQERKRAEDRRFQPR
jgi:hypothetical protein